MVRNGVNLLYMCVVSNLFLINCVKRKVEYCENNDCIQMYFHPKFQWKFIDPKTALEESEPVFAYTFKEGSMDSLFFTGEQLKVYYHLDKHDPYVATFTLKESLIISGVVKVDWTNWEDHVELQEDNHRKCGEYREFKGKYNTLEK